MKFYSLFRCMGRSHTLFQITGLIKLSTVLVILSALQANASENDLNVTVPAGNAAVAKWSVQSTAINVTGSVKDEAGLPVPGAAVKVKRTNAVVITDSKGDFSLINVQGDDVLIISYVGYTTTEIPINNRSVIAATLKEQSQSLAQVVVVGYGTQRKIDLSGAVSSINYDEELQNRPITNLTQAISGNASGITVSQASGQPGRDGSTLRIRGVGTLNDANPLILIDGIVGTLNNLNPNDVADISILKDAASAAIYGSRAANGVVLVTTKKGKSGRTIVNYNAYYGVQEATNLFKTINNYATYMETMNKIYKADNPLAANVFQQTTIDAWRNATDRTLYPNTDWMKVIFEQGNMLRHNLSVSGGTDKTKFYLSGEYLDNKGAMIKTDMKDYSLRLNLDHNINTKLKVGGNISANLKTINEPFNVSTLYNFGANATPGTTPKLIVDGETRYGGRNTNDESIEVVNPLQYAETWFAPQKEQYIFSKLYSEWEILQGLKLQVNGSAIFRNQQRKTYQYSGPIQYTWNMQTMQIANTVVAATPSTLTQRNDDELNLTFFSTLNYIKDFNQDHHFNILAGISREKFNDGFMQGIVVGFPSNDLWELNAGLSQPRVSGQSNVSTLSSYFARVDYNYKDKYLFQSNLRYDGSSRFAKGNRWGLFPSFSGAWRLSEEPFFKSADIPAISSIKFRGSWGKLGNQNIPLYRSMNLYGIGQNYIFGGTTNSGIAPTALSHPGISWETTTTTNVGVDLGFFTNKLNISMDWFNKKTDNVLVQLPLPATLGNLVAPFQNVGIVKNIGWDLEVAYRNKFRAFSYGITGNLNHVENEVVKFQSNPNTIQSLGNNLIIKQGEPINSIFGYEAVGIFQNQAEINAWPAQKTSGTNSPGDLKYKDQNGDHVINASDRVIIGNNIPNFYYGFGGEIGYKGFNLNFLFQGVSNVDRYYQNLWYTSGIRYRRAINAKFLEAWTPENQNTTVPRVTTDGNADNTIASSYWVQDASFLRLKNIQLSYSIPAKWANKILASNIQIYANGQNLFTKTKFNGLDPETATPTNSMVEYPNVKIISFGVNVSF
ncbi:TonB-dependent receptor [Pedobacter heparinus]|uniref:SusC/RagA family TonB-linked outer membrane protein n=1 Tax=Pedobacter heparinus TaxID=984 RepID=UPI00292FBE64|nr:TonB-dependent receptor [Pedobacter heparinus]